MRRRIAAELEPEEGTNMTPISEGNWVGAPAALRVLGDQGPWTWYQAEAWQQAAAPDLFVGPSRRPSAPTPGQGSSAHHHGTQIAYWAPLLHLTTFGLGWRFPELGLWRWIEQGMPTDDPLLATIFERYGSDVDLIVTWLAQGAAKHLRSRAFQDEMPGMVRLPRDASRRANDVLSTRRYEEQFEGGNDPHHLIHHMERLLDPCEEEANEPPRVVKARALVGSDTVDYLLVGEQYRPLFYALHDGATPPMSGGRSTRVGVLCPPIGWLGTYRRSRETGLWFRGRHRWHTMGNV